MSTPKIYALHENPEWFPPFAEAFAAEGLEYVEWVLTDGVLDLDEAPPEGIFWSRISASSHTRDHGLTKDYSRAVLSWLEASGRRTVNGRRVLELEVSKVDQLTALRAAGIDTPRTVAAVGRDQVLKAAQGFPTPFVTKHNQGGKGLGVRKFESFDDLADYVGSDEYEEPVDGITLIQEYVVAADGGITRVEIVGGEMVYAVRGDTERGGFQLCPADACAHRPGDGPARPAGRRDHLDGARRGLEPVLRACGLRRPGGRQVPRVHAATRDRGGGDREHPDRRRPRADVRREHQHELQQRRRAGHREVGAARDRAAPGSGAEGDVPGLPPVAGAVERPTIDRPTTRPRRRSVVQ